MSYKNQKHKIKHTWDKTKENENNLDNKVKNYRYLIPQNFFTRAEALSDNEFESIDTSFYKPSQTEISGTTLFCNMVGSSSFYVTTASFTGTNYIELEFQGQGTQKVTVTGNDVTSALQIHFTWSLGDNTWRAREYNISRLTWTEWSSYHTFVIESSAIPSVWNLLYLTSFSQNNDYEIAHNKPDSPYYIYYSGSCTADGEGNPTCSIDPVKTLGWATDYLVVKANSSTKVYDLFPCQWHYEYGAEESSTFYGGWSVGTPEPSGSSSLSINADGAITISGNSTVPLFSLYIGSKEVDYYDHTNLHVNIGFSGNVGWTLECLFYRHVTFLGSQDITSNGTYSLPATTTRVEMNWKTQGISSMTLSSMIIQSS